MNPGEMKKLKIYLDTSIINLLFADDSPEKQEISIEFFESRLDSFDVFISEIVLFEITRSKKESNAQGCYYKIPVAANPNP